MFDRSRKGRLVGRFWEEVSVQGKHIGGIGFCRKGIETKTKIEGGLTRYVHLSNIIATETVSRGECYILHLVNVIYQCVSSTMLRLVIHSYLEPIGLRGPPDSS